MYKLRILNVSQIVYVDIYLENYLNATMLRTKTHTSTFKNKIVTQVHNRVHVNCPRGTERPAVPSADAPGGAGAGGSVPVGAQRRQRPAPESV